MNKEKNLSSGDTLADLIKWAKAEGIKDLNSISVEMNYVGCTCQKYCRCEGSYDNIRLICKPAKKKK